MNLGQNLVLHDIKCNVETPVIVLITSVITLSSSHITISFKNRIRLARFLDVKNTHAKSTQTRKSQSDDDKYPTINVTISYGVFTSMKTTQ